MKKIAFACLMIFGVLSFSEVYSQIQPQEPNEPKVDIKVNREYDENGNVTRYDSTWTSTWSSPSYSGTFPDSSFQFDSSFGDFSMFGIDSLFQQFNLMMPGTMFPDSMLFNGSIFPGSDPFGKFGSNIQSLFDDPFFNHPGNRQGYDAWMEQFKQQMDSLKQNQAKIAPPIPAPKPSPKKVKYNQPVKNI